MSRKLNLNSFFTSRFYTVILTQYLWFFSSDLHSSFCLIYFREVTFKVSFQNKRDTAFLSLLQIWSKSVYSFLHPATVHYHHAQFIPLPPDATTVWLSCFSEHHLLLLTMTTPRGAAKPIQQKCLGHRPCAR